MKPITTTANKVAVDTNILIQLYEVTDPDRRELVGDILLLKPVISAQVVSEFLNVLRRITRLPKAQVLADAIQLFIECPIAPVAHSTLSLAARLLARYDFQLFDAIVVASALESGCDTLYSADFQHNQLIEGSLRIVNPFL